MGNIFGIIAIPLGWLLTIIYNVVRNYGVALLLFTLVTKIILFPLAWNQKKSSIKMAAIQPMLNDINKKYANNPQKRQEETVRLQQENGISMASGCLPMLIQLPILFGLIEVIYKPLKYIAQFSAETIEAATKITTETLGITLGNIAPEASVLTAIKNNASAFANTLTGEELAFVQDFNMSFLGLDLTVTPSLGDFGIYWVFPILSVAAMLAQQLITMKLNGQKMEGAMKWIPIYTTVMFGYFSFVMPCGVTVYWIFSSVFGILQDLFMRIFFDPDKEKAKIEKAMEESRKKAKKAQQQAGKTAASRAEQGKKRLEKARAAEAESEEELTAEQLARLEKARAKHNETYGAK